jgi:CDP-diacylglycerol---serine O-phosphatidyltransferase
MPRERDPDEPRIYFLPNLMTACNLACGFFAVLMILKGQIEVQKMSGDDPLSAKQYYEISKNYYEYAIMLIFGSCLFDLLDGRLARLGGQESPFGQEFDSLADIISFGMAPAMLLSRAVLFPLGNVGWAIALIYLICGAMRLARFNCLASLPKKPNATTDFRGLPIPMAAGFIASMLGLSLLMISDVRYPSFKKVGLKTRGTFGAIVVAVLLVFAIVQFRYVMPVVLFSLFLLYGFIRPWVSQKLRREIEVEEDDDPSSAKISETEEARKEV